MNKRGGRRANSGRKSKSQEQNLVEKLTAYEKDALLALGKSVKLGEPWAVKLFFEYKYGKPVQKVITATTDIDDLLDEIEHGDDLDTELAKAEESAMEDK